MSEFKGEALTAAAIAFARCDTDARHMESYAAFSEQCQRAAENFKAGNLTTNQYREFLLRNGYTKVQARDEIEQRIEEMNIAFDEERACIEAVKA